jgi:4-amino-4-deoxy-L-arabinose transferase-like glycosyltransferase
LFFIGVYQGMSSLPWSQKPSAGEVLLVLVLTALAGGLLFSNLVVDGWGNTYYAAGVRSMLHSWSNFFFAAYDPSGFVSLDKPPLGFWLQALSASLFGFSGPSLLFPQALAGFASVLCVYFIVRKRFGILAAAAAALVLATTPIFVAAGRNNTIDTLLTLIFVLISWAFIAAVEKRRVSYLYLAFALLGLGFEVKMMEALLIAPALGLGYWLTGPGAWPKRVIPLLIGTVLFLVVGLAWAAVVELTPPQDRPFVGSTRHNSEGELILGHNGFDRLGLGGRGRNRGDYRDRPGFGGEASNSNAEELSAATLGFDTSRPGPLRFFQNNGLSTQVSWVLVFSAAGAAFFFLTRKRRARLSTPASALVLFWSIWLATEFLYFSFTGGMFHTYYLTTLAPAAAALTGVGFAAARAGTRRFGILLFAGTLVLDLAVEVLLIHYGSFPSWQTAVVGTLLAAGLASLVLVILSRGPGTLRTIGLVLGVTALSVGPATLSAGALVFPGNGSNPTAGWKPARDWSRGNSRETADKLARFLIQNRGTATYALAVPSSRSFADDLIIRYDLNVLPLGGFMGSDPIVTPQDLQDLVQDGKLPFAMAPQPSASVPGAETFAGRFGAGSQELNDWIRTHGKLVPRDQWTVAVPEAAFEVEPRPWGRGGSQANLDLYDLRTATQSSAP